MTCIPFYFTDDCKQNENERKTEIKRSAMLHLRSKRTPRTPSTISKALVTRMVVPKVWANDPTSGEWRHVIMFSVCCPDVLPLLPVRRFRTKPAGRGRWWSGYVRIRPRPRPRLININIIPIHDWWMFTAHCSSWPEEQRKGRKCWCGPTDAGRRGLCIRSLSTRLLVWSLNDGA